MTPDHVANGFDVLIELIRTAGPIIAVLATWWASRGRQKAIAAQITDTTRVATAAAQLSQQGNDAVAEVHQLVNGKNDALVAAAAEKDRRIAELEAVLAQRRAGDPV